MLREASTYSRFASHIVHPFPLEEVDHVSFIYIRSGMYALFLFCVTRCLRGADSLLRDSSHICPWGPDCLIEDFLVLEVLIPSSRTLLSSWLPPEDPIAPRGASSLLEAPHLRGADSLLRGAYDIEVPLYLRGTCRSICGAFRLEVLTSSSICVPRSWFPSHDVLYPRGLNPSSGYLYLVEVLIPSSKALPRSPSRFCFPPRGVLPLEVPFPF